jgi:hypothetical protein
MLGRGGHDPGERLEALAWASAADLIEAAARRLGRECERREIHDDTERAVVAASAHADLLIVARDGDRSRLGPKSPGKATRFVTKQAAQKRFVPKADELPVPADEAGWQAVLSEAFRAHPFSRFTPRARHSISAAAEEARERRHDRVVPEHIALGLLHEPEGLAAKAIEALGVPLDSARQALVAALPPAAVDQPVEGKIPSTPQAKKVLQLAVRDALRLGHNYIGTEHLLLGVLEYEQAEGSSGALTGLGVTQHRASEWLGAELKRIGEAKRQASAG